MLEFTEAVLTEIRKLKADSEALILSGGISNMERYRFLMGRLEGLNLIETAVKELLKRQDRDF